MSSDGCNSISPNLATRLGGPDADARALEALAWWLYEARDAEDRWAECRR
jgi:hypothetical protein